MVDVKRKRCEQAGCSKQPRYNFEGEQRGRFCAQHKVGCSKQLYFNFEGERRGRFNALHKLQGMVDVVSKKCEKAGCSKGPSF